MPASSQGGLFKGFKKGFSEDLKKDAEAEADAYLTAKLRHRVASKLKAKAQRVKGRETLQVSTPFVYEEADLYEYGGLHAFDRRAFLAEMAFNQRNRQARTQGQKECRARRSKEDRDLTPQELFAIIDTDGSGGISRDELVEHCELLSLTVSEAHQLFDRLDDDGSGDVDLEEFAKAVQEIENNAVFNIILAICDGDVTRLDDGLRKRYKDGPRVDLKRLHVRVVVTQTGEGTLGTAPLINFPNQNGDLGRKLGADEDRRIPRCSHVCTDELEIAHLGKANAGISGGLFLVEGDTLLHAVARNCHLSNRVKLAEVLLKAGANPNALSSDGKRPFELDFQGKRHVWERPQREHKPRPGPGALSLGEKGKLAGLSSLAVGI